MDLDKIEINVVDVNILWIFPSVFCIVILISFFWMKIFHPDYKAISEYSIPSKLYKRVNIYNSHNNKNLLIIGMPVIIFLLLLINIINLNYSYYIISIVTNMDYILNIVLGLTSVVCTVSIAFLVFDKKYYLTFSMQNILQKYGYYKNLLIVIVSCMTFCFSSLLILDGKIESYFDIIIFMIIELSIVINIFFSFFTLFISIKIMFSYEYSDLKLLDKINNIFWTKRVDFNCFKSSKYWNKSSVETNLDYLIENFLKNCKNVKIENIDCIQFVSAINNKQASKEYYILLRCKFIIIIMSLLIISTISNFVFWYDSAWIIIAINFLLFIITVLITYTKSNIIRVLLFRLFSDTWGYYIKGDDIEIFVPRLSIKRDNKYDKLINSMNNLLAFLYIELLICENEDKMFSFTLNQVIESIKTYSEKNDTIYLPIFLIGYFAFVKDYNINNIIKVFDNLQLDEEGKKKLRVEMNSILFELTQNYKFSTVKYPVLEKKYFEKLTRGK